MKLLVKLTLLAVVATAIFYIHGESLLPFVADREASTEPRPPGVFNSVNAGGATNVSVRLGDDHTVEVIARDSLMKHVTTEVSNNTLYISRRSSSWFLPLTRRGSVQVNVTLTDVTELRASSATTLRMDSPLQQRSLRVHSSGSSDLYVTADVEMLDARASGSSDIRISGRADHSDIHASGSSDFRGRDFSTNTAEVQLSGSSSARLSVNERVSGSLSGSSDLHLQGNALVDIDTSGSSSVTRRD